MFRYGRPQKGRYRQFYQVGAEIIGSPAPGADVEIIALFVDLFEAWGFSNLTVMVNSVGTPADAPARTASSCARWLAPVHERAERRLAGSGWRRIRCACSTPRIPKDQELFAGARGIGADAAHARCARRCEPRSTGSAVLAGLDALGIAHEIDHGLVRGLDYYTRTAFEVHDTLARRAERARRRRALRRADRGARRAGRRRASGSRSGSTA